MKDIFIALFNIIFYLFIIFLLMVLSVGQDEYINLSIKPPEPRIKKGKWGTAIPK